MNTRLKQFSSDRLKRWSFAFRDKNLTKKTPGSFTKEYETHSFHTE
jgi:hypothetical protein